MCVEEFQKNCNLLYKDLEVMTLRIKSFCRTAHQPHTKKPANKSAHTDKQRKRWGRDLLESSTTLKREQKTGTDLKARISHH